MNVVRYEPRYRPFGLLDRLLRDENLASLYDREPDAVTDWLPAVDIREEEDRYLLKADLPGVKAEDIDVTMEDGVLTIQGSRRSEKTDEQAGYKRYERVQGSFLRRFTLPDTADSESIEAHTDNGVLEVTIAKQARIQPRKIAVKNKG